MIFELSALNHEPLYPLQELDDADITSFFRILFTISLLTIFGTM